MELRRRRRDRARQEIVVVVGAEGDLDLSNEHQLDDVATSRTGATPAARMLMLLGISRTPIRHHQKGTLE